VRAQCPSTIDESTSLTQPNSGTQVTRAVYLAVRNLKWSLHLHRDYLNPDGRQRHLFDVPVRSSLPTLAADQCSSTMLIDLTNGGVHIAHDIWSGWTTPPTSPSPSPSDEIHIYTDGSHDSASSTSSWSVVVGDRWFDENFGSLPNDEEELARQPGHLGGSTRFGSAVSNTTGVYPVELQAIARVLAMFPLDAVLHIHSDSQASIKSIQTFLGTANERDRLRSAARPLLLLIDHLCRRRAEAGGTVSLSHVHAHTNDVDPHSVGNRIADFEANRSRLRPDHPSPLSLEQLPIQECEPFMYIRSSPDDDANDDIVIINDIRSTSLRLVKSQVFHKWKSKSDGQEQFACDGMRDMGRVIMRHGSHQEQQTFVHVATNTIHYHRVVDPNSTDTDESQTILTQLQCRSCHNETLTLTHLMSCRDPLSLDLHRAILTSVLDGFDHLAECSHWLQHARDDHDLHLHDLMVWLFPLTASSSSVEEERHDHTTRCMVGAFTAAQCNAALRRLGIKDQRSGHSAFITLRRVCLEHIGAFYTKLKLDST
jgi:ribonuclease HI